MQADAGMASARLACNRRGLALQARVLCMPAHARVCLTQQAYVQHGPTVLHWAHTTCARGGVSTKVGNLVDCRLAAAPLPVPRTQDDYILEMCRFGAGELHVVAAIMGGLAAQVGPHFIVSREGQSMPSS